MNVTSRKVAALAVAICCGLLQAQQAPQWDNLFPRYTGLSFGEDTFLSVAGDGVMRLMNADGSLRRQRFETVTSGPIRQYHAVAYASVDVEGYASNRFVVTQNLQTLQFSENGGLNWLGDLGHNNCPRLMFGRNRIIGSGQGNTIHRYRYNDLMESWEWTTHQSSSSTALFQVAANDDIFVAVGSNIVSSMNGDVWTQRHSGYSGNLTLVAYGADKFVAFGQQGGAVFTSADGEANWTSTASNVPANMRDLTFGGGMFVTVGNAGAAASSSDGITWTLSTLNAHDDFIAVRYGNGAFMALGANGSVYTSANGVAWSARADGRMDSYRRIIYSGGKFVAVGDSGVSLSTDGRKWSGGGEGPRRLNSVAHGNNRYIAVGDSGIIFTSADGGTTWTDMSRPDRTITLLDVAYGGGMFITVGRRQDGGSIVLALADGATGWADRTGTGTWSSHWNDNTQHPISVAFVGTGAAASFVVGGSRPGVVKSTPTGEFWSNMTLPNFSNYRLTSIVYENDRYIALGTTLAGNSVILTSPDGSGNSWTTVTAPQEPIKAVTFAKGYYIAVGDTGRVIASPNGQQWVTQYLATNRNLRSICFGNDVLVAGGDNGVMLYSDQTPTMTVVSVRHTEQRRQTASRSSGASMSLDRSGRAPTITLSFTPERAGRVAVYSLAGRQLYKKNMAAGVRAVSLPRRVSGSIVVRYTDNDGKNIVQRFQITR